jgi:hypothetical protein
MMAGRSGAIGAEMPPEEFTIGTAPSDYTFGGILGTQESIPALFIEQEQELLFRNQYRI